MSLLSGITSLFGASNCVWSGLEEALESPLQEFIEDGGLNGLEEALEGPLEEIIEDGGLGALEEALESPLQELIEDGCRFHPDIFSSVTR
jgi:hypothetical protein